MMFRKTVTFAAVGCSLAVLAACASGSSSGSSGGSSTAPTTAPTAQAAASAVAETATKSLPAVNAAAAQTLLSPDQTLQVVSFPTTGTTTVSGKIEGYKSFAYAVSAMAGQTLTVTMTTPSSSAYFNVRDVRDQSGAAVHRGEVDGAKATISVPADTTYLIEPFLVRAVARRGSTATYTLTIGRQ